MRIVCVWRDNTDTARAVTEWLTEMERTGQTVESLDPDTLEGETFARAHDVVEYPTVLVATDEGTELKVWRGVPLPSTDEVLYYSQSL